MENKTKEKGEKAPKVFFENTSLLLFNLSASSHFSNCGASSNGFGVMEEWKNYKSNLGNLMVFGQEGFFQGLGVCLLFWYFNLMEFTRKYIPDHALLIESVCRKKFIILGVDLD